MKHKILLYFFLASILSFNMANSQPAEAEQTETIVNIPGIREELKISVYPSPSTGILNIQLSSDAEISGLEIFDMLGNTITNITPEKTGNNLYTLNLTGMKNGFYFIKFHSDAGYYTRRVTLSN